MSEPPRHGGPTRPRARPRARRRVLVAGALILPVAAAGVAVGAGAFLPDLSRLTPSTRVLGAEGRLLRVFPTEPATGEAWRLPAHEADVDPLYLSMLLAIEDKRFPRHGGVDPLALARAVAQALEQGRVVSGASTLTMQVARLLEPRPRRTLAAKLLEMAHALALESRLGKQAVLNAYLTLAPFGGNLEGVRAGSLAWFGKEPRTLTPGEAALLVALPRAPEALRPDRHPMAARHARDRVLDRLVEAGVLSARRAAEARAETIPTQRRPLPRLAPHLTTRLARTAPPGARIETTLDHGLQSRLETLARDAVPTLAPGQSMALLAVESRTGRVLASVGSPDDLDESRCGAIDMTRAVRSPGSALKPLIYGMAFERHLVHPATLINDRPVRFGVYTPSNFDDGHWGEVTARDALAHSLNIPAVLLLERVGPLSFAQRLAQAGIPLRLPAGTTRPGLPLALGGLGVTLEELVGLMAAIDAGGRAPWPSPLPRTDTPPLPPAVLAPDAAWQVADILAGSPPPPGYAPPTRGNGGRVIAFKTGTSYGYRDAWAIGFDGAVTVGVWVGRPDGSPSPGEYGRITAAPVLFRAFERLEGPPPGPRPGPSDPFAAITRTADLPAPLRRLDDPGGPARYLPADPLAPRVVFPPDGTTVDLGTDADALVLSARGGQRPLVWLVDGRPLVSAAYARETRWSPSGPGQITVTVIDARGRADTARVWLRTSAP
ncbi:penicillin-binding protein 1C [Pararhodospirillum oryzae]|uniref:peptidoglycan glycosyltransferase n=1 Tax=Pararhodospirillum oryzae TaxID=478448 RepID=A0A512H4N0_9PROT|nr:penicillin-binding protein 1C [Pararhodospirillum oryzae]GEO80391.1 penicillin-binding protein 1C [Pararhodospirillum oryzae]